MKEVIKVLDFILYGLPCRSRTNCVSLKANSKVLPIVQYHPPFMIEE